MYTNRWPYRVGFNVEREPVHYSKHTCTSQAREWPLSTYKWSVSTRYVDGKLSPWHLVSKWYRNVAQIVKAVRRRTGRNNNEHIALPTSPNIVCLVVAARYLCCVNCSMESPSQLGVTRPWWIKLWILAVTIRTVVVYMLCLLSSK